MAKPKIKAGEPLGYPKLYPQLKITPYFKQTGDTVSIERIDTSWGNSGPQQTFEPKAGLNLEWHHRDKDTRMYDKYPKNGQTVIIMVRPQPNGCTFIRPLKIKYKQGYKKIEQPHALEKRESLLGNASCYENLPQDVLWRESYAWAILPKEVDVDQCESEPPLEGFNSPISKINILNCIRLEHSEDRKRVFDKLAHLNDGVVDPYLLDEIKADINKYRGKIEFAFELGAIDDDQYTVLMDETGLLEGTAQRVYNTFSNLEKVEQRLINKFNNAPQTKMYM